MMKKIEDEEERDDEWMTKKKIKDEEERDDIPFDGRWLQVSPEFFFSFCNFSIATRLSCFCQFVSRPPLRFERNCVVSSKHCDTVRFRSILWNLVNTGMFRVGCRGNRNVSPVSGKTTRHFSP